MGNLWNITRTGVALLAALGLTSAGAAGAKAASGEHSATGHVGVQSETDPTFVQGAIRDSAGQPVPNATITLVQGDHAGTAVGERLTTKRIASTKSDRNGKYRVAVGVGAITGKTSSNYIVEVVSGAGTAVGHVVRRPTGGSWVNGLPDASRGASTQANASGADQALNLQTRHAAVSLVSAAGGYCSWYKLRTLVSSTRVMEVHATAKTRFSWSYGETAATALDISYQLAPGGPFQADYLAMIENTLGAKVGQAEVLGSRHSWARTSFQFGEWELRADNGATDYCTNMPNTPHSRQWYPESWIGGANYDATLPSADCSSANWPAANKIEAGFAGFTYEKDEFHTGLVQGAVTLGFAQIRSTTGYGTNASIRWVWNAPGWACSEGASPNNATVVYVS